MCMNSYHPYCVYNYPYGPLFFLLHLFHAITWIKLPVDIIYHTKILSLINVLLIYVFAIRICNIWSSVTLSLVYWGWCRRIHTFCISSHTYRGSLPWTPLVNLQCRLMLWNTIMPPSFACHHICHSWPFVTKIGPVLSIGDKWIQSYCNI